MALWNSRSPLQKIVVQCFKYRYHCCYSEFSLFQAWVVSWFTTGEELQNGYRNENYVIKLCAHSDIFEKTSAIYYFMILFLIVLSLEYIIQFNNVIQLLLLLILTCNAIFSSRTGFHQRKDFLN